MAKKKIYITRESVRVRIRLRERRKENEGNGSSRKSFIDSSLGVLELCALNSTLTQEFTLTCNFVFKLCMFTFVLIFMYFTCVHFANPHFGLSSTERKREKYLCLCKCFCLSVCICLFKATI